MAVADGVVLLVVAALWGASFLFIREAAPALGPVSLMEARVLIAGLGLLVVGLIVRRFPDKRADFGGFLVLGALSAAVPFTLIAAAELRLTASLAAILNATTPLFALLVSAIQQRRRPSQRQLGGVLLGVVGVAVLVGLGPLHLDGALVLATCASLLAAMFYALGGVYAKSRFSDTPPMVTATGQQLGAAALLLIPALALPPRETPTGGAVVGVLTLALACTALAFGLFYRLVNRVGPTGALTVTFLVPVFGLLWGALFLDEDIGWTTPVGLALVLSAVFLVTDLPQRPKKRIGAPSRHSSGPADDTASAGRSARGAGQPAQRERGE